MPSPTSRGPVEWIDALIEASTDVAPVLSDRVRRLIATPLYRHDPDGAARSVENRLDVVRDRVMRMASRGRVETIEWMRIQRAMAWARQDAERLIPLLPAVRAQSLQLRTTHYTEAIALLPDPNAVGADAGRDSFGGNGLGGGLRRRKARRRQVETVAALLAQIDEATRRPRGVDLRDLDRQRHELMSRVVASNRLDGVGADTLRRIEAHLDVLLLQLIRGELAVDLAYLVKASITDYLPDTLEPYLALEDPRTLIAGRPAHEVVAGQLASIEAALAEGARRPRADDPDLRLILQEEFLRARFGDPTQTSPFDIPTDLRTQDPR